MKNAVGRDIPEYLLKDGREVYQGKNYMDGKYLQKAAPRTRRYEKPQGARSWTASWTPSSRWAPRAA